jgi:molybdopterin-containing oxidoreductase family membrane subunit
VAFVVLLRARDDRRMALAAALAFTGVWMEKGMGLVVSGFSPAPLGGVPGYLPTLPETAIALGVWAAGALAFMATRGAVRWGRGSSQA